MVSTWYIAAVPLLVFVVLLLWCSHWHMTEQKDLCIWKTFHFVKYTAANCLCPLSNNIACHPFSFIWRYPNSSTSHVPCIGILVHPVGVCVWKQLNHNSNKYVPDAYWSVIDHKTANPLTWSDVDEPAMYLLQRIGMIFHYTILPLQFWAQV